jgi:hypothetical protein
MSPVALAGVEITDEFWRIRVYRRVSIQHCFRQFEPPAVLIAFG